MLSWHWASVELGATGLDEHRAQIAVGADEFVGGAAPTAAASSLTSPVNELVSPM